MSRLLHWGLATIICSALAPSLSQADIRNPSPEPKPGFFQRLIPGQNRQSENDPRFFRPAPIPPLPQSSTHAVPYGGEAVFEIRTADGPPVEFIIRRAPRHGTLTDLGPGEGNSRILRYTHTSEYSGLDEFLFAVQAAGTVVSAPARVFVQILPPTVEIEATPLGLEFGSVLLGSTAMRSVLLKNNGTGHGKIRLKTEDPWMVAGSDQPIEIAPAEEVAAGVIFRPGEGRQYFGTLEVEIEGEEKIKVALTGEGSEILGLQPRTLTLEPNFSEKARMGLLTVVNLTDAPQRVQVDNAGLESIPSNISLEPRGQFVIRLRESLVPPEAFERSVVFRVGGWSTEAEIRAGTVPGFLVSAEKQGFVLTPEPDEEHTFMIENPGGLPVSALVEAPDWVAFDDFTRSVLFDAGEKKEIRLFLQEGEKPRSDQDASISFSYGLDRKLSIPIFFRGAEEQESDVAPVVRGAIVEVPPAPPRPGEIMVETEQMRREREQDMLRIQEVDTSLTGITIIRWLDPSIYERSYLIEERMLLPPEAPARPTMQDFLERRLDVEATPTPTPDGEIRFRWTVLNRVTITAHLKEDRSGNEVKAVVEGLRPSWPYTLKITPLRSDGKRSRVGTQLQFTTPPEPPREPSWLESVPVWVWWGLGLAAVLLVFSYFRRKLGSA
jgi:hypothetical protein